MTARLPHDEIKTIDHSRWNIIKRKAAQTQACYAFALFEDHGIQPILIKGLAADLYYPASEFRDSVDMDIAVASKDFEAAKRINLSPEAKGLAIDLHCELRHLDTLGWAELFERSESVLFDSGKIRILCPEDHLRVLSVHWLTDGGANKDRLRDIYYLIQNRPNNFDWDRFLNQVGNVRRRWLVCTVGLAKKFLGLDLSDTPIPDAADSLPPWLVKTVENEWSDVTPLRGLHACLDDRHMFVKQLKKRLPPNPICATVLMNGSFDAKTRIFYQIGTSLQRIGPSIANIAKGLLNRSK